jgi:Ca2+-binding RTX toxin-like protein
VSPAEASKFAIKEKLMAYSLRDLLSLHQAWSITPDWHDAGVIFGTSQHDTLNVSGGHHLILSLGGNDTLHVTGVHNALGNAIFSGAGNDTVMLTGDYNFVSGDGGNDFINFLTPFDPVTGVFDQQHNNNVILGGSGDDFIGTYGEYNVLDGGTGNDGLSSVGSGGSYEASFNILTGGVGDDILNAYGIGDQLFGGSGADYLFSLSATRDYSGTEQTSGSKIGTAQTLTAGSGQDSYRFYNLSDLIVEGDQNGELSKGDVITGLFPVITDYEVGEEIDIGSGGNNRQTSYLTLGGTAPGEGNIRLAAQTHAIIQGDMTEAGRFQVDDQGDDSIIVFNDSLQDSNIPAAGSVVLQDYVGEVTVRNEADNIFIT